MDIWGLTGGIASGKSTVSNIFRSKGAVIVDADVLAREVVAPGRDGLRAIVERFGPSFLLEDGSLNRKKLGALVFTDPQARADLGAITHPRIAQLSAQRTVEASEKGAPVVIYDAPLLIENGIYKGMQTVILVAVTPQTQKQRLMQRDGLSEADALARISSQMSVDEKRKVATVVFENDGALEDLKRQVEMFWARRFPAA